jgi:membrane associated rhomboid family serine protease
MAPGKSTLSGRSKPAEHRGITRCLAKLIFCITHWFGGEKIFDWNRDGKFDEDDLDDFIDWAERAVHIQLFTPRVKRKEQAETIETVGTGRRGSLSETVGSAVRGPVEEDELVESMKISKPWFVFFSVIAYAALWCYWAWYQMAYEDTYSYTPYTAEMTMAQQFPDDGNTYSFLNGEKAQVDYCEWECNLYDSCVGIYFRHHVVTECVLLASLPVEECSSGCASEYDSKIYTKADTTITNFVSKPGGLENIFPGRTTLRIHGNFCEGYSEQVYRLWTYQFTHGSMSHVLANTFAIVIFGAPLELLQGTLWLFVLFQVGVVGGGLCTWLTSAHTNTVGASGGAYALIGMQIGDLIVNWKQKRYRKVIALFFIFFLSADMFNFTYTKGSSISYSTHSGGLITGLLAELVLGRELVIRRRTAIMRGWAIFFLFVLALLSCGWYLTNPFPAARGASELFYEPGFIGPWCWVAQACIYPDYATGGTCPSEWQCVGCQTRECVEQWYAFAASSSDPSVYLIQTNWETCREMAKLLVGSPNQ